MNKSIKNISLSFSFIVLFILFSFLPKSVFANTLAIFPSSGAYNAGQVFSVNVSVSSPSQSINAISGSLSFPKDILQVVSVSKANSILSLWVQEPSFSNTAGTINFEGVVPNPGYTGNSGKVITVNFKALKSGTANLSFKNGTILANDGKGTNVTKTLGTGSYLIGEYVSKPDTTVIEVPLISKVKLPIVTYYPKKIQNDEILIVKGTSELKTQVTFLLKKEGETVVQKTVNTESDSRFIVASDQTLAPGKYEIVLYASNSLGQKSDTTVPLSIEIKGPFIETVLPKILNFLSIAIQIISLVFFIIFLLYYGSRHIVSARKRLLRELDQVDKYIDALEKARNQRTLTPEEEMILKKLKEDIKSAEKIIK